MHAVLITFKPSFDIRAMSEQLTALASELQRTDGLLMKTWITQGPVAGGFHVFRDRDAADRFVSGPQIAEVIEDDRFAELDIRHFDVLDAPSLINGTPSQPFDVAAAA
jgi:hypothetical protein